MNIIANANILLEEKSPSITYYPAPNSEGSINDYFSNGSYWWPNPETENSLPYIRRDGILNPNNFTKHKDLILNLSLNAATLYRAFQLTGEKKYIKKLEENLCCFFINNQTKMNPSLNFSQAIPGVCKGRSIGIIDTLQLIDIPIITLVAEKYEYFSKDTIKGLRDWFSSYTSWLINSSFGKKECNEPNNHSITYYAQLSSFSLLSPARDKIKELIRTAFKKKLITQINQEGLLPKELARTRPFGYSIFALDNLSTIALLSSYNNDLWSYENMLKKAIDKIFPYIQNKQLWPYDKDVEMWETMPSKSTFLYFASHVFDENKYMNTWEALKEPNFKRPAEARHIAIKIPEVYISFLNL